MKGMSCQVSLAAIITEARFARIASPFMLMLLTAALGGCLSRNHIIGFFFSFMHISLSRLVSSFPYQLHVDTL